MKTLPLDVDQYALRNKATLFKTLSDQELEAIANIAQHKSICAQQYLLTQQTPAESVYNLISGMALIERTSSMGERQILAFLFPGDFVGLTNSEHFEYSVKSLSDLHLHEFKRKALMELADRTPHLKENMQKIGANVLSRALDQVYVLGKKRADQRLCYFFLHLLERMPGASADKILLPMTRQDMADFLGLTIETVSRSLSKLKKENVIAFPTPQHLEILDLASVEELGKMD